MLQVQILVSNWPRVHIKKVIYKMWIIMRKWVIIDDRSEASIMELFGETSVEKVVRLK